MGKVVKEKVYITPAPTPKVTCHKETSAKHPFAGLEKNVKQIMKLKGGVEKAQKGCKAKAESKVKVVQKEATTKLEKSQKMVVAARPTSGLVWSRRCAPRSLPSPLRWTTPTGRTSSALPCTTMSSAWLVSRPSTSSSKWLEKSHG